MSNELQLVTTRQFDGITLNCYVEAWRGTPQDFWATRTQIGELLRYADPNTAIKNIHNRNKDRLDKFSRVAQIELPSGGIQEFVLYNFKGLLEICRYSNQPTADAVMDVLWDIADEIRKTGSYSVHENKPLITKQEIEGIAFFYEYAGLKGNQATLALDKYLRACTGRSALDVGEVVLEAPTKHQLLTPTEIGQQFNLSARRVNDILAGAGWQYNIAGKWEPLGEGTTYAVMQDIGKRRSDGTPIRQLKWDSSIMDVFSELIEEAV